MEALKSAVDLSSCIHKQTITYDYIRAYEFGCEFVIIYRRCELSKSYVRSGI